MERGMDSHGAWEFQPQGCRIDDLLDGKGTNEPGSQISWIPPLIGGSLSGRDEVTFGGAEEGGSSSGPGVATAAD